MKRFVGIALSLCVLACLSPFAVGEEIVFFDLEPPAPRHTLEVHFINVACADCILLRLGTHTLLLDSGNRSESGRVTAYLEAQGVERLEYVMESHPHSDHIQGFQDVLESVEVETYLRPSLFEDYESDDFTRLNALLDARGVPVQTLRHGDTIPFGEATLTCYQWQNPEARVNNRSMLLHVQYGERSVLLTGDIENHAQKALAEELGEGLRADILKMPHHGLAAYTIELHRAVEPRLALITNTRGVEAVEQVICSLTRREVPYRLVTKGTIVALTQGTEWTIRQCEEMIRFE